MHLIYKKTATIVLLLFFLLTQAIPLVYADDPTPTPTVTPAPSDTPSSNGDQSQQIQDLNNKINELENKISDLHSQEDSLSSQIDVMDNQMKLTQYRIDATKQQINELTTDIGVATKRMKNLEGSLNDVTKVLINRIVATYQAGGFEPMQMLLTSTNVNDFFTKESYLRIVQDHDKQLIYATQQAKNDYANQKNIYEDQKQKVEALQTQLQAYTTQLDQQKKSKQDLLSVTKNDESRYQALLEQAKEQINAFKSFATSQVGSGASILPAQPSPDGWYFNQRDERWGRNTLGSSSEQIWEVGCLDTSIAMVLKKHGQDVTPGTVAANSDYFFSNTAYMLLPWADGKFTSTWGYSQGDVDSKLSGGEPVIIGLKAGPLGMHFIVLKSGSGGSYKMNDPWNGPDLNFSDYYSTGQIFQYGWYSG